MKKIFFLLLLLAIGSGFAEAKHRFDVSVNIGVFYNPLARYGEWVESDWGYSWRPLHVRHGWRPYLHGRWAWTDYGWYWVSNEPFGWATYHYGRWQYDDYYGWIWIPDNEWGPAWVEWRYDDDYIGWAPLPPIATFNIQLGISFSSHWIAPIHYWNFIPFRHFTSERIDEYVQTNDRVRRIYNGTHEGYKIRGENDRIVNRGIDMNTVERRTDSRIRRIDIIDRDQSRGDRMVREGNSERIEAYRPKISEESGMDRSRIRTRQEDIRPESRREQFDVRTKEGMEERNRILRNRIEKPDREQKINSNPKDRPSRQSDSEQRSERLRQSRENAREPIQPKRYDKPSDKREREIPRMDRQRSQNTERRQPQVRERSQTEPRRDETRSGSGSRRRP
jgi:hypothetical protein